MAVTTSDIAQAVGVSRRTVGVVLNETKGNVGVSEATRNRILDVARELGYRPHAAARAVRNGRFGTIGLLMSVRPARSMLPPNLLSGIQTELAQSELHLTLATLTDDKLTDESYIPRILREHTSDGLLINYNWNFPQRMVELIEHCRIPAAWVNAKREFDCVYPDDYGATQDATEWLLGLGHRRIVYVDYSQPTTNPHFSGPDRLNGYAAAMTVAGLSPRRVGDSQLSELRPELVRSAMAWMGAPDCPSAVVTYSRHEAELVLHVARMLNLSVPGDISLVCIDGEAHTTFDHTLSTMLLPHMQIGEEAVKMVMRRIQSGCQHEPSRAIACTRVQGDTVSPVGAGNP